MSRAPRHALPLAFPISQVPHNTHRQALERSAPGRHSDHISEVVQVQGHDHASGHTRAQAVRARSHGHIRPVLFVISAAQ